MSTLTELADRLGKLRNVLVQNGQDQLATYCESIVAELRQQPQSVNAELLRDKERLDWCESQGSKFNAEGNYPRHYNRSAFGVFGNENGKTDRYWEGATFREAIDCARAESVEKAPAQSVNQQMLDALRALRSLLHDLIPELGDTISSEMEICCAAIKVAESAPAQPDVVSGLVDALRNISNRRGHAEVNRPSHHADDCPCAIHTAKRAIEAYEAQSKAEPKA